MLNKKSFEWNKYPVDTKRGLIYYSFWWFVALFTLYIKDKLSSKLFICWFILILVYWVYWIFKRFWFSYLTNKLYVIFAVTIDYKDDKKLLDLYEGLINNFKEKLKDYELDKVIKVKVKPADIEFSSHSAAEAKTKLNTFCSTLILSGLPITSEKETEFKFNFHYEFKYPGDKDREKFYQSIFSRQIAKALKDKEFKINSSLESKKNLYSNLFNASTYILALCVLSIDRGDVALDLLKPTVKECNENVGITTKYGPLIADVRELMFSIIKMKFDYKYWGMDITELKPLALDLQKLDKHKYATHMALAIVSELEGNRDMAIEHTEGAKNNHPKYEHGYKFNYLYFYLSSGEHKKALETIVEMKTEIKQCDFHEITNFLFKQYDKTKEIALIFNSGIVNYFWGNKELGLIEIEKFKNLAKRNDKYKELLEECESYI